MVIGGIAVIAHGVARQTIDIDATVLAKTGTSEKASSCSISSGDGERGLPGVPAAFFPGTVDGGAAPLPGMLASKTIVPVLGGFTPVII